MFLVRDRVRANAHYVDEKLVMVTYRLVLPVNALVWIVEGMMTAHLEYGHVSTRSGTDLLNIGKTNARLANY